MQTKREIRQLLLSAGVRPNGHLGQHFLIDLNLMRLLVDSANIRKDDIVLEVGCGTGSLTQALVEKAGQIVAVELDRNLFEIAENQLAHANNIKLINTDILASKHTIHPAVTDAIAAAHEQRSGRILLVANLPYNVASPVMMNLLTGPITADAMVVTVQKEVADANDRRAVVEPLRHIEHFSGRDRRRGNVKNPKTDGILAPATGGFGHGALCPKPVKS